MSLFREVFAARAVHKRIIDSEEWQAVDCQDDLANAATFVYHLKVGAKVAHGSLYIWSEGKVKIEFFEGATLTADGTSIDSNNLNRETDAASITAIFHTPTEDEAGEGTLICETKVGQSASGGIFGSPASGGSIEGGYWFLKPATSYQFKVTNQSGEPSDICFKYEWHEHIAV